MDNNEINAGNLNDGISQRAVSVFSQGEGIDDFPVLKAFQQYIDAEQEKARKRIVGLGILFGAVLIVVVAIFMILLHGINMRNQALSDRLVEYAMKEPERRQNIVPVPMAHATPSPNDAALKAMADTLISIQKKMLEKESAEPSSAADKEHEQKLRLDNEKITQEKILLQAEKKRLEEEKERLRQIEIDRQRRKLYPELYEENPSQVRSGTRPSRTHTRMLTDEDIREIIREAYPDEVMDEKKLKSKTQKGKTATAQEKSEEEASDDDEGAIEYFKDDDYTIPVDVMGSSSKVQFTIPVDESP